MFYMYCMRMGRPEEEFWDSRYGKIITMLDMRRDEDEMNAAAINHRHYESKYFAPPVKEIHSMKEIEGFV